MLFSHPFITITKINDALRKIKSWQDPIEEVCARDAGVIVINLINVE